MLDPGRLQGQLHEEGPSSASHNMPDPSQWKPRASRFPIQTAVRYREQGQAEWSNGTSLNISRSGILFQAERGLKMRTKLELQLVFPAALTGGHSMSVVCWGTVVRRDSPMETPSRVCLATNIFRYHLVQQA